MAADEASKRLERAAKLLETARDLQEKQGQVIDELRKIIAGEAPIGDLTRALSNHYLVIWEARYGSKYQWQGAKDSVAAKRLVQSLGVEDLKSRATRFLKDDDPFYVKARHPFALFASNVNRYIAEKVEPLILEAPVVEGCKHQPPCQSDQTHTQRRRRDMQVQA